MGDPAISNLEIGQLEVKWLFSDCYSNSLSETSRTLPYF